MAAISGSGQSINNIIVINYYPNSTGTVRTNEVFEKIRENVTLSNRYINTKATQDVKRKITMGDLKDDAVQKANYKAKVYSTYVDGLPWLRMDKKKNFTKQFTVEKSQVNQELGKVFTEGLSGISESSEFEKLENALASIGKAISASPSPLMVYLFITAYERDDSKEDWKPWSRGIAFAPSNSLTSYYKDPRAAPSVNIEITYAQSDGMFDQRNFSNSKSSMENQMKMVGGNPVPVSVFDLSGSGWFS